jgi:hypothetical protein
VGDRVVTARNSRVTITLTDNSKLELDESTSLAIDQQSVGANSRNTKLSLFTGLVRSFVLHTSPSTRFQVYTPNAVASARGTEYDTATDSRERKEYKDCRRFTQVSVYDGTVEVTNTTNPSAGSVKVSAGYRTLVACGLAPAAATPLSAAATTTTAATTTAATTTTTTSATVAPATVAGATVAGATVGTTTTAAIVGVGAVAIAGGVAVGTGAVGGGGGGGTPLAPVISPRH